MRKLLAWQDTNFSYESSYLNCPVLIDAFETKTRKHQTLLCKARLKQLVTYFWKKAFCLKPWIQGFFWVYGHHVMISPTQSVSGDVNVFVSAY